MQLPVSHIDRVDASRAAREQDFGEAAGRGADIKADAVFRIEGELIERGRELDAAARNPWVRRCGAQHCVGGDFVGGLGDRDLVGGHPAGRDGGLRLGAALEQAAFDQQTIDALAGGHPAAEFKLSSAR